MWWSGILAALGHALKGTGGSGNSGGSSGRPDYCLYAVPVAETHDFLAAVPDAVPVLKAIRCWLDNGCPNAARVLSDQVDEYAALHPGLPIWIGNFR